MRTFRQVVFWLHLICGVFAGIVIGIMSFTGAALAFEKEIIAFIERDARRVTPPSAEAKPLALEELTRRIREARPDYRPAGFVITNDPHAAISLSAGGRGGGGGGGPSLYANPYTGEVREAQSPRTRAFLRTMNTWHRWMGVEGDNRNVAKGVTGACNVAFLFLGISGLYLWWPRSWSARAVRAIALFDFRASGKARDFNWHNVIGLWTAPVLIVLTATAMPISYRWAGDMIYKLTGTEAPAPGGPGGGGAFGTMPVVDVPKPAEGVRPLNQDAILQAVQKTHPHWEQITIRAAAGGRGRIESAGHVGAGPQPISVTLKESGTWPRTATTTLALDPYTGAELQKSDFGSQNLGRRVRTWTRFLHTGEALGWGGQFLAGLASLGGCVLVYTGFALACRRFFGRKTAA